METDRVPKRTPTAKTVKDAMDKAQTERQPSARKGPTAQSSYNPADGRNQPEAWVKKWVDYSSKYGLGYILSNGSTGVFFNDSTKIILEPTGHNFSYIERKGPERVDTATSYTLTDFPKEMTKKVTLLQHFRSYLEVEQRTENQEEEKGEESKETPIYVKKWMRTRHAIMFRLSNKIVQVNFQDSTEIILSSESRVVTYVNKRGERNTYPLTTALESPNSEMTKRLKYTKDILTHMLNNQGNAGSAGSKPSTKRAKS
jgi:polo-like kinase 1